MIEDELLMTVTLYAVDVYVRLDILVIRSLDITLCIHVRIHVYAYPAPPKRLHFSFSRPPSTERRMEGAWPRACYLRRRRVGSGAQLKMRIVFPLVLCSAECSGCKGFGRPIRSGGSQPFGPGRLPVPLRTKLFFQYKQKEFAARECTCARCTCRSLLPLS